MRDLDTLSHQAASGATEGEGMTRLEFWSAVMGLSAAIVVMFNQMNGSVDRLQADTNSRFDQIFHRMDRMQAENNRRFDTLQAENQRQHDAMQEVLRVFEGRVTRVEERLDMQSVDPVE